MQQNQREKISIEYINSEKVEIKVEKQIENELEKELNNEILEMINHFDQNNKDNDIIY